jgi:acyl carrier protein
MIVSHSSEIELVEAVIRWLCENAETNRTAKAGITPDTDLIASGVLTSRGFIELLLFIEDHTGCRIDLNDVEPSEFSVIGSLCRLALRNQNGIEKHGDDR